MHIFSSSVDYDRLISYQKIINFLRNNQIRSVKLLKMTITPEKKTRPYTALMKKQAQCKMMWLEPSLSIHHHLDSRLKLILKLGLLSNHFTICWVKNEFYSKYGMLSKV